VERGGKGEGYPSVWGDTSQQINLLCSGLSTAQIPRDRDMGIQGKEIIRVRTLRVCPNVEATQKQR